ncbi:predicted protein [Botrytis cinerea T4]|uniref:Uncharacterized protein n=1 Tax=Botryotinia fuckeliana (strain T4) TaxID=999810 RepID=G2Y9R7_BOTF4|nr:predicted protein [Botrytis cinerea T4]
MLQIPPLFHNGLISRMLFYSDTPQTVNVHASIRELASLICYTPDLRGTSNGVGVD